MPSMVLTGLGETIGLGHLGQSGTLLTDVADLPGGLVQGQGVSALSPILTDTGAVTGAAGTLLGGVTGLASGLGGEGAPLGGLLGGLRATRPEAIRWSISRPAPRRRRPPPTSPSCRRARTPPTPFRRAR